MTATLPRISIYRRPTKAYIAGLVEQMRDHGRKRRTAMDAWSQRDKAIKARRGGVSWMVRVDKLSDTAIADIWSEYTFHRDEGLVLAAEIQAECAALRMLNEEKR